MNRWPEGNRISVPPLPTRDRRTAPNKDSPFLGPTRETSVGRHWLSDEVTGIAPRPGIRVFRHAIAHFATSPPARVAPVVPFRQAIGAFPVGTPHSDRTIDPRPFILTATFDW